MQWVTRQPLAAGLPHRTRCWTGHASFLATGSKCRFLGGWRALEHVPLAGGLVTPVTIDVW